jgi:hypothetical protein
MSTWLGNDDDEVEGVFKDVYNGKQAGMSRAHPG